MHTIGIINRHGMYFTGQTWMSNPDHAAKMDLADALNMIPWLSRESRSAGLEPIIITN